MLSKLIKHDLSYSAKPFLAMAVIAVALTAIMFLVPETIGEDMPFGMIVMIVASLSFVGIGIASIVQIFQFYSQSMFSNAGYLTFTLPAKRSLVYASKLIVSMIWVFLAIATVFVIIVMLWFITEGTMANDFWDMFNLPILINIMTIVLTAMFLIATMFFCITLSHSIFVGKKIHGVISGVIGFAYTWLNFWLIDLLSRRYTYSSAHEITVPHGSGTDTFTIYRDIPMTGIRYGRIVVGEVYGVTFGGFSDGDTLNVTSSIAEPVFIDIFQIGLIAGLSALAIAVTYYLLKKRVSLR